MKWRFPPLLVNLGLIEAGFSTTQVNQIPRASCTVSSTARKRPRHDFDDLDDYDSALAAISPKLKKDTTRDSPCPVEITNLETYSAPSVKDKRLSLKRLGPEDQSAGSLNVSEDTTVVNEDRSGNNSYAYNASLNASSRDIEPRKADDETLFDDDFGMDLEYDENFGPDTTSVSALCLCKRRKGIPSNEQFMRSPRDIMNFRICL